MTLSRVTEMGWHLICKIIYLQTNTMDHFRYQWLIQDFKDTDLIKSLIRRGYTLSLLLFQPYYMFSMCVENATGIICKSYCLALDVVQGR